MTEMPEGTIFSFFIFSCHHCCFPVVVELINRSVLTVFFSILDLDSRSLPLIVNLSSQSKSWCADDGCPYLRFMIAWQHDSDGRDA